MVTEKAAIQSYDAIVIGAGQAGPPLARRLAAIGMKVAVIERGAFGGTCVNTGCIPTKTLIASAYAAHMCEPGRTSRAEDPRRAGEGYRDHQDPAVAPMHLLPNLLTPTTPQCRIYSEGTFGS
jgi:phytoene dehydrogenase-like protein